MRLAGCVLGLLALALGAADTPVAFQHPDVFDARPWTEPRPSAGHVVIIDLEGAVTFGLSAAIKRQTEEALAHDPKPDLLIYRIDTYGGTADSALKIADMIGDIDAPTTVAYIPKKAISAGALIAISCRQMVMGEGSTIARAPFRTISSLETGPTGMAVDSGIATGSSRTISSLPTRLIFGLVAGLAGATGLSRIILLRTTQLSMKAGDYTGATASSRTIPSGATPLGILAEDCSGV